MRRDRIYLSGPVTSIGEAEARKNFQKAEDELRYLNYITVNPMKMRLCVWIARHFGKKGYMLCLLIELLQLVTKVGVFDVDDIIMNTTGTLIGYIVFRVSLSIARRRKIKAIRREGYAKTKKTE